AGCCAIVSLVSRAWRDKWPRIWRASRITHSARVTMLALVAAVLVAGLPGKASRAETLKAMSFNILMDTLEGGSNASSQDHWFNVADPDEARRLRVFDAVHDQSPDILGLQEVSTAQFADLNGQYISGQGLLGYDHYAFDPGINSYFTAIYYRADR